MREVTRGLGSGVILGSRLGFLRARDGEVRVGGVRRDMMDILVLAGREVKNG